MSERNDFIKALRDCADFFEQHPGIPMPRYTTMNIFHSTREALADYARMATWEKVYNGEWFFLRKEFGAHLTLDIATSRETVCRRVVTGTTILPARPEQEVETVEWVCEEALLG